MKIILLLNWRRKKFGPIYKELENFSPQILSLSSQKYGFGIRIHDPGSATLGSNMLRCAATEPDQLQNLARFDFTLQNESNLYSKVPQAKFELFRYTTKDTVHFPLIIQYCTNKYGNPMFRLESENNLPKPETLYPDLKVGKSDESFTFGFSLLLLLLDRLFGAEL